MGATSIDDIFVDQEKSKEDSQQKSKEKTKEKVKGKVNAPGSRPKPLSRKLDRVGLATGGQPVKKIMIISIVEYNINQCQY